MKRFLNLLLLASLLVCVSDAFSQPLFFSVQVTSGQCEIISNVPVDSVMILDAPSHGTIGATPLGYQYCADSGYTGIDSAIIYACISPDSGFTYACDTVILAFEVKPASCNFGIGLVPDSLICVGGNRSFKVVIMAGMPPYTYYWSDGSTGQSACEQGPGQSICVTATDANGCTAAYCSNGNPGCNLQASIGLSPNLCGVGTGLEAVVTGGSAAYTYNWSTAASTAGICAMTPGLYCVTVTDTTDNCSADACYQVGSGSGQCEFKYYPGLPAIPNLYDFIAFADTTQAQVADVIWSFGDGTSGTGLYTSHTFTACGTYWVGMTVIFSNGDSCYYSEYVAVCDSNNACNIIVNVASAPNVCSPGSDGVLAYTSGGAGAYTYLWNTFETTQGICVTNGTYCVTVYDANGCSATDCYYAGAGNGTCRFQFNGALPAVPNTLEFTAFTDSSKGPAVFVGWLFGDSTIGTGVNIIHTFPTCNIYLVTLSVIYANGDSCTYVEYVYPCNNMGSCSYTYTYITNNKVRFISQTNNVPTYFTWNFGDGTGSSQQHPIKNFAGCGFYPVTLTVYDAQTNDTCFFTDYIYISCDSDSVNYCQAYFYHHYNPANDSFYFEDYTPYGSTGWLWDFGDGTTSAQQNPAHAYNAQGTYNVCLTITNVNGCSSSYCQQVSNIPVQDMMANLYHSSTVTPGFAVIVGLGYYNKGTLLTSGTVTYRYPDGTTFTHSTPAPDAHDVTNHLLTYNYSNILPGVANQILVHLQADVNLPLNTVVNDTLTVNPLNGDATPADNVAVAMDVVTGSWDPNDKAVSPKGEGPLGIVEANTEELSYLIRFQNTGTAPAHRVVIRDEVHNNIDLTSVVVTGASHEHTTNIVGNLLIVTFDNIMLPDSGSDYHASQGYITLRARLKPGLTPGTQITNTAGIYFDFNAPVITNTVTTTLFQQGLGINNPDNHLDFVLMPNPASSQVYIAGEFDKGTSYELYNQLGQVLLQGKAATTRINISVSDLSAGMYFVKVKSGDKLGTQRLVITR